jgi:hypothetical protein
MVSAGLPAGKAGSGSKKKVRASTKADGGTKGRVVSMALCSKEAKAAQPQPLAFVHQGHGSFLSVSNGDGKRISVAAQKFSVFFFLH